MRCQHCGRGNRPDALFCDACGVRVTGHPGAVGLPSAAEGRPQSGKVIPPRSWRSHSEALMAESAFVGRQQEMEALKAALEALLRGAGCAAILAMGAGHQEPYPEHGG